MKFCVVGAGFSGAVIARHLAEKGYDVIVLDERDHLAGNCYTERDSRSGIMLHRYGPHIFHTDNRRVWDYVCQFGTFRPFVNRVKAIAAERVYTLPINLLTINQFFGTTLSPEEAQLFLEQKADKTITSPKNFEEQALSMIGPELYQAFFYGYTKKQWGLEPTELPASILKRLPVRFNYDDNYFNHTLQGIPEHGYTQIVFKILAHERITVCLNTPFESLGESFSHVFYTGPIDRYFAYRLGRLSYRTLDFERIDTQGDLLGTAVMNYCDAEIPYTRIAEHKYFTPWELQQFDRSVSFREFSRFAEDNDSPYYPIRLATGAALFDAYAARAREIPNLSFLGRLGTYRYLDMDVTIGEALTACDLIDEHLSQGRPIPTFFLAP